MDRARNADTATLTAQIYYFLQSLGAEEALQKLTDGLRACGDLPNADEALREWNVITELLDQMVHLLPAEEPITPVSPGVWGNSPSASPITNTASVSGRRIRPAVVKITLSMLLTAIP